MTLLDDLENDTVNFQPNYDGREREPVVLPAKFPNLLVNGAGGIAVGMATNIPPHNLGEVIDACIAYLDNPAISIEELIEIVPGPDFPTAGLILGRSGIRAAYHKGRGSILMRGRVTTETVRKEREALIISEIPYQVNKAAMVEKIAELVREKKIEGISDIRDEFDRQGMRVVIELKRDAMADVVLNQLYRFSPLQSTFGANMVALIGGRPEQLNLKDLIRAFTEFREEVVGRRTKFLLRKARDRAHVLVGLGIAVANIDEVIALIRKAPDPATAREQLMARDWPAKDVVALVELIADPRHKVSAKGTYRLSEEQARAILDLRLQRLTALGRDEIGDELTKLGGEIADYLEILRSRARIVAIVKGELTAIKAEFGTPRRTEITEMEGEVEDEDLIQREDMVVTVSHKGYIKRVPLSAYRAQRRGGKGRAGMATRDEDFVTRIFIANTHTPVLFFSTRGMAYKMTVWRLPLAAPQARGKALVNLLPLDKDETITTILPLPEDEASWAKLDVMFATNYGSVRRNKLSDFIEVRQNGKIAMKLDPGDRIVGVGVCGESNDVLLTAADGQAIRFPVTEVRVFKGRESAGVRGIKLEKGDQVISMAILSHIEAAPSERNAYVRQANMIRRGGAEMQETEIEAEAESEETVVLTPERYAELSAHEEFVLTVSENGYGKRTSAYEYRISGRGGKGIIAMVVNQRNGKLLASFPVEETDQIMLVTDGGQLIRVPVAGHQRDGPLDARGHRVLDRRGRARRLGRAYSRRERRGERRAGRGLSPGASDGSAERGLDAHPAADLEQRPRRRGARRKCGEVAHHGPVALGMADQARRLQARHDARQRVGVQPEIIGDVLAVEGEFERHAARRAHAGAQGQFDQQGCHSLLATELAERGDMESLARQLACQCLVEIARDCRIGRGELVERGQPHPPNLARAGRGKRRLRMRRYEI